MLGCVITAGSPSAGTEVPKTSSAKELKSLSTPSTPFTASPPILNVNVSAPRIFIIAPLLKVKSVSPSTTIDCVISIPSTNVYFIISTLDLLLVIGITRILSNLGFWINWFGFFPFIPLIIRVLQLVGWIKFGFIPFILLGKGPLILLNWIPNSLGCWGTLLIFTGYTLFQLLKPVGNLNLPFPHYSL